jgi:citrate lyase subunit beta/citryl-CoA lyase
VGELPAPIDGVTVATGDDDAVRAAATRARGLGFGGKLCIHPRQVAPVADGFRPSGAEVERAEAVLAAAEEHGGAGVFSHDGVMVDAPVLARARAVLARASTDGRS